MKFSVVTILPELIAPSLTVGVVGRAREAGTITVETVNPRDFTDDKHRTVDDTPYGGGPGMVMKAPPLLDAIDHACWKDGERPLEKRRPDARRILLSPAGQVLTQAKVRELATLSHVVLVCGRYEGVDDRVRFLGIDEEISLGDYVLSGGELGALVLIDAIARLVPGVLGDGTSADDESHSAGLLEYPQYTRPLTVGESMQRVPAVLSSGNHAAIATWRREQALRRTAKERPDLWRRYALTTSDAKIFPPLPARTHLALVHHPVTDRTGAVVTTSLTNFDIHDLARSTLTYGLAAYHIVTPITSQREKAEHIAALWHEDAVRRPPESGSRANALALVKTADSIETVISELAEQYDEAPIVVATSARPESFPAAKRQTCESMYAEASISRAPMLILLGTGWGLADALIPSVSHMLAPIEGASDWNHLSVRSAAAILMDRLFGRPT